MFQKKVAVSTYYAYARADATKMISARRRRCTHLRASSMQPWVLGLGLNVQEWTGYFRFNLLAVICRDVDSYLPLFSTSSHIVKMLWNHEAKPSETATNLNHVITYVVAHNSPHHDKLLFKLFFRNIQK